MRHPTYDGRKKVMIGDVVLLDTGIPHDRPPRTVVALDVVRDDESTVLLARKTGSYQVWSTQGWYPPSRLVLVRRGRESRSKGDAQTG